MDERVHYSFCVKREDLSVALSAVASAEIGTPKIQFGNYDGTTFWENPDGTYARVTTPKITFEEARKLRLPPGLITQKDLPLSIADILFDLGVNPFPRKENRNT